MHNAPAVSYPVGRSRFQKTLLLVVLLAGAFAQGLWWLQSAEHGVIHGLGFLLWLMLGAWAFWSAGHTPQQQLVWDGQDWRLESGARSSMVTPQVILDLQHDLLVFLRPAGGSAFWVWPTRKAQPERWLALRRALFNPASPVMIPDSSPMAASPEL
jgi:hypothetical protein